MHPDEIKRMIEAGIPGCEARVQGDGSHFEALVVSDAFEGKSMVDEQRMVYAVLDDKIQSGAIHALTIKAYTPQEWETARKLQVGGA